MSVLLQHFKWITHGFSKSASMSPKRLSGPDVKPLPQLNFDRKPQAVDSNSLKANNEISKRPTLEGLHEISIYIHRFHNLDLFQQGWYQLKVTIRWENGDSGSFGTPARVVQYEGKHGTIRSMVDLLSSKMTNGTLALQYALLQNSDSSNFHIMNLGIFQRSLYGPL